jgi:RNA polymerase sigma factor (sigma-70 family)
MQLQDIERLRNDRQYLGQVYLDHKDYCLRFMRRMTSDRDVLNALEDVYQDAIIALYENSQREGFTLNCSLQTYLNSVCRNQLLSRFRKKISPMGNLEDFLPEIDDELIEIKVKDEQSFNAIEKAIEVFKVKSAKCYEILRRFFYQKQRMEQIALELGYTNAANAKNQKAKCQKRLKQMAHENMLNGEA